MFRLVIRSTKSTDECALVGKKCTARDIKDSHGPDNKCPHVFGLLLASSRLGGRSDVISNTAFCAIAGSAPHMAVQLGMGILSEQWLGFGLAGCVGIVFVGPPIEVGPAIGAILSLRTWNR